MNLFISVLFLTTSLRVLAAEPCFVVCPSGCNIAQGASYAESEFIYQDVRAWNLVANSLGYLPSAPSELDKLAEFQANATCEKPETSRGGHCSSNYINGRIFTGYDISNDGPNARTIIRVRERGLDSTLRRLNELGQCE